MSGDHGFSFSQQHTGQRAYRPLPSDFRVDMKKFKQPPKPALVGCGELPVELLEHVARFALENGLSFADTSRSLRNAALHAAGAASLFELVVLVALRKIAGDDIAARMRLVQRALSTGHHAQLFTWPPADPHPLPSPLREHICQHTGVTAHTLPLEHNMTVHISDPNDQDAAPFLPIQSIAPFEIRMQQQLAGRRQLGVQRLHARMARACD